MFRTFPFNWPSFDRLMASIFFFSFLFLLHQKSWAEVELSKEYKEVYLTITGPSGGRSIMGHGFIIFAKSYKKLSSSTAFQFNFKDIKTPGNNFIEEYLGHKKPLSVQRVSGLLFTNHYKKQNRPIYLFRVELRKDQQKNLFENLLLRVDDSNTSYHFLTRNCLTEMLYEFNRVLDKDQEKFKVPNRDEDPNYWEAILDPNKYIISSPMFHAPQINNHPLIKNIATLRPLIVTDGLDFLDIHKSFTSFSNLCLESNEHNFVLGILKNPRFRFHKETLLYLKKKEEDCASSQSKDLFQTLMKKILWTASSMAEKINVMKALK